MSDPVIIKVPENTAPKKEVVLEMRNITKTFGSIVANKNVVLTESAVKFLEEANA